MSDHGVVRCKFTQQQKNWIRKMIIERPVIRIIDQFNKEFCVSYKYVSFCQHMRLAGINCTKIQSDALPIGSKRINKSNGQMQIKYKNITGRGHDRDNWRSYASHLWEQIHGEIPDGYIVAHMNRNPLDDRLENLELISRKQCIIMGKRKWFTSDTQLTRTGLQQIRLQEAMKDAQRV